MPPPPTTQEAVMDWLEDEELLRLEYKARKMCHSCPVYTGDQVRLAVQSGMRSANLGDEWMRYRTEVRRRGLLPTTDEATK